MCDILFSALRHRARARSVLLFHPVSSSAKPHPTRLPVDLFFIPIRTRDHHRLFPSHDSVRRYLTTNETCSPFFSFFFVVVVVVVYEDEYSSSCPSPLLLLLLFFVAVSPMNGHLK